MHYHANEAIAKGAVGGAGVILATVEPSRYISYFDRIYDTGLFLISGEDVARGIGLVISVLVGINIIYNVNRDWQERRGKKKNDK